MSAWASDLNNPDKIELGKITTQDPTYETLKDWFNTTQSSGLLCGGGFTDNTDGSITVATGCGMVKTVDDIVGNTIMFDWPENTNVSLTDNVNNWIYIDYNGGTPIVASTVDFSIVDFTTQFIIGFVFRDGTTLNMIQAGSRRFDFAHRVLLQDFEVNGFSRASGLNLGETGTRNISILEGVFYILTQRTILSAVDTSGSDTFTYYYSDGAGGWTEVTGQTQINNLNYDDGDGTLGELTPNQYGVHWVYQDFSGNVHVVYGLDSYKLAAANDVQPPASGSIPPFLDTFAFISGKIIIEKDATAFAELHSAFDVIFTPSVSIPHNDTTSIQGGTTDEYYHLTSAQHAKLIAYVAAVGADTILDFNDGRYLRREIDIIGVAGESDFGVGVCDPASLPSGMVGLADHDTPGHDNHGNYQYSDGSIMVYVPKFYYIVGTGANGFDVNVIDIKGIDTYADTATANAAGYALHRAFIDGGSEQNGFFVDKYQCSKNAYGTGYIGSSIKNGLPIACHDVHNPITDLTACSAINYYEVVNAARARDGVNGAVNPSSIFFCASRFIRGALALLSMAHGQAAISTTNCAWYSAGTTNFPKGCNDDTLGDTHDGTVAYVSDGYGNCGKTGSGTPFDKTTHNGQNCGVADLCGLMYEVVLGITSLASTHAIEDMSRANPCQVTETDHGASTGDYVYLSSISQAEWINLSAKLYKITVVDSDNFTLDGVDTSGFSAAYNSVIDAGTITIGKYYAAKESSYMSAFTSGETLITDHWGTTGVIDKMDEITPGLEYNYPNNGRTQYYGDGANQVLSEAISGNDYILTGLGLPESDSGVSSSGSDLFGTDYFYQHVRTKICVRCGGAWSSATNAGVWAAFFGDNRTGSNNAVGYRAATYPA